MASRLAGYGLYLYIYMYVTCWSPSLMIFLQRCRMPPLLRRRVLPFGFIYWLLRVPSAL